MSSGWGSQVPSPTSGKQEEGEEEAEEYLHTQTPEWLLAGSWSGLPGFPRADGGWPLTRWDAFPHFRGQRMLTLWLVKQLHVGDNKLPWPGFSAGP